MQREMKIRMWNFVKNQPSESSMFYGVGEVLECLKQQMLFDSDNTKGRGYNHVGCGNAFEWFTGLKDKNGKDIYEGDVCTSYYTVKGTDNGKDFFETDSRRYFTGVVEFKDGAFWLGTLIKGQVITVIGNVHENPELL